MFDQDDPEELDAVLPLVEQDDDVAPGSSQEGLGDQEVAFSDDDAEGDASLDELLARRAAHAADNADTADNPDSDDVIEPPVDDDSDPAEALVSRVIPIKGAREFVCNRCHLVKAKTQLADSERVFCRDCA